jgi:branched-chain amino acid transport system substrate-binding protein
MAEAAKRTAAKINAAGGVLGRKLELFIEDSESSAAVAANLTQKFINVHKAQSCLGYWGTPEGMSSRPIAMQNKVVLMVSSAANAITEGDTQGYVWRFQMKATDWGIVISRATTSKLGFKSVGVLGLQNAFVLPIMKVFEENMKAAGRQVVDSLIYNPEQPSYRAEVERIFGKKPEAVYCFRPVARLRLDHEGGLPRRLRVEGGRAVDHGRRRRKIRAGGRQPGRRRDSATSSRCPTCPRPATRSSCS